jgi:hypothetical protein
MQNENLADLARRERDARASASRHILKGEVTEAVEAATLALQLRARATSIALDKLRGNLATAKIAA